MCCRGCFIRSRAVPNSSCLTAEAGLLKDKRIEMDAQLSDRHEVLP
jgi:hypothetical protein